MKKKSSGRKWLARQISNNNQAISQTENGLSINLRAASMDTYENDDSKNAKNSPASNKNTPSTHRSNGNGNDKHEPNVSEMAIPSLTPAASGYSDNGAGDEQNNDDGYGTQMFCVIAKNLQVYKDEELQIVDTDSMNIEADSSVLGYYINDYVVYIDEPFCVYVAATDVQELDATNVDGYQWETGRQTQSQTQVTVDNSGLTGILTHVPNNGPSNGRGSGKNSGHSSPVPTLNNQLSVPNKGHNPTESQGTTIVHDTKHSHYNSAEISLPYNEEVAASSNMMSIDAALASQYGGNGNVTTNGNENGTGLRQSSYSHNSQSRSRSRGNSNARPNMRRTASAGSRGRTQSDYDANGYNGYNTNGNNTNDFNGYGNGATNGDGYSPQTRRPHSARSHRSHSRSQSRSSHHSHRSNRSHRSSQHNPDGSGQSRTGTHTTGDQNEREMSASRSRSHRSRSRRGSISSVSTFHGINHGGRSRYGRGYGNAGGDEYGADVLDGASQDGSSVHYVAKDQLKNPLYFNQVANEILARRATHLKDNKRQKETIVDNIIVNRFYDARPVPGKKYFTQCKHIRNGIAVVIPFCDEPATELETTLTQLYDTHAYLCDREEIWAKRPFNILLVQDGWSKADESMQRYLKKLFPKQYFFNTADNGADEMVNVNYDEYNNHRSKPVSTAGIERDTASLNGTPNMGPLRPPLQEQHSRSYEIKYGDTAGNHQTEIEMSKSNDYVIQYEDSYNGASGKKRHSQSLNRFNLGPAAMGGGAGGHSRGMTENSVSEYAPSIAMELPQQSQYWWEYFEEFDGSYKPSQGPITFIFEKTVDNPSYFQLKFNRNENGRFDKRIEHQLTLHLTLIIKLDKRSKHNSREWFLARSGFAEKYRAKYLMTTNAFTLFDHKCLYSMVRYLEKYNDCSVVAGRERAMSRGQQGKKRTEFRCSFDYALRLTQTFDWELSNNVFNPTYGTVGFLPVVPGQCGLYRASDILQDNAREWYFKQVNSDPQYTGLILGNLQHFEDRLLTYAAVLKVENFRRVGYVSDALFYKQIGTSIEQLVTTQREWIDGTFSGFLYLLYSGRQNFWQWRCDQGHKMMIFFVFLMNFIQLCTMFFGPAMSFGMIRTSLSYVFENYLGGDEDIRTDGILLFIWLLFLIHIVVHNTMSFNSIIIKLLFMVSILTSLSTLFTYSMLIFYDGQSFYDALFADFITEIQYEFVSGLIFYCIVAPFPCSIIIGGVDSCVILMKSICAYFFTFNLMWSWVSSYAIVRCWDIDFDDSEHADDKDAGNPLINDAQDARERMEARFLQKSRLVMLLLIFCNIAAYMVPYICFAAVMIFVLTLAFFVSISIITVLAKSVGIDLRFYEVCCTLPENRKAAQTAETINNGGKKNKAQNGMPRPGQDRTNFNNSSQNLDPNGSFGAQSDIQSHRESSESSNEGFVIIPEVYKIETKAKYDKMRTPMGNGMNGSQMGGSVGPAGHQYNQSYGGASNYSGMGPQFGNASSFGHQSARV